MTNAEYPTARRDDLVVQETDDEVLVYDLKTNKASCLNSTASLVWKQCDGTKNVEEITEAVSAAVEATVSEDLVKLALSELSTNRLLVRPHSEDSFPDRLSRRQLVKKIGLSSAIAVPVVISLLAPPAYAQASACNIGVTCTCTISGMDAGGFGMACAPPNTGGCSTATMCVCLAQNNGNPVSPGVCGIG